MTAGAAQFGNRHHKFINSAVKRLRVHDYTLAHVFSDRKALEKIGKMVMPGIRLSRLAPRADSTVLGGLPLATPNLAAVAHTHMKGMKIDDLSAAASEMPRPLPLPTTHPCRCFLSRNVFARDVDASPLHGRSQRPQ